MQSELQKIISNLLQCGINQSQIDAFAALYSEAEKLKIEFEEFDQYEQDGPLYITLKIK
jgi:hypothetical protein